MTNPILELYGRSTASGDRPMWSRAIKSQICPFTGNRCIKVRKSSPDISIGTCTVQYGKTPRPLVICPLRFLEKRQVFTDSLHLLQLHEPGNELHIVPEVSIPGGSIDYFLVSAHKGRVKDFAGIEIQTLDTTGTLWTARQRFLGSVGLRVADSDVRSSKKFGMNWKMTAKTILVQLHHKIETFEHLGKHIVLATQDSLMHYMRQEFSFSGIRSVRTGDPLHFHSYSLDAGKSRLCLQLTERTSTDSAGLSIALGLQAQARVELDSILGLLERKISDRTLWTPA